MENKYKYTKVLPTEKNGLVPKIILDNEIKVFSRRFANEIEKHVISIQGYPKNGKVAVEFKLSNSLIKFFENE